jgi:hypothetical protein
MFAANCHKSTTQLSRHPTSSATLHTPSIPTPTPTPMSSVQAVKPVLVIGSTGNIGNATVTALAAKGTPTRAGVRDPASEKAAKLASLEGVEVVSAAYK